MNCSTIRRNLLTSENPRRPAEDEVLHFKRCASCRVWHSRLANLERALPLIPTPISTPPQALLDQILQVPRIVIPSRTSDRVRTREAGRQKLALAFSLAASLAIFTLGWWAWPHSSPPKASSNVAVDPYTSLRDKYIAQAATPSRRALALTDLATEFLSEVRQKSNDPARLDVLADYLERLLREDLIHQVQMVAAIDRPQAIEEVASRLQVVESEASRLAAEWERNGLLARSVRSMERIATSAEKAGRKLRLLA